MKVLVSGSRSIIDFSFEGLFPADTDTVICGGAKGIDRLALRYANSKGLESAVFAPDYELYGRGAPLIRNKEMVDLADFVIIIRDGRSKGTKFTADYAKKRGKPMLFIDLSSSPEK